MNELRDPPAWGDPARALLRELLRAEHLDKARKTVSLTRQVAEDVARRKMAEKLCIPPEDAAVLERHGCMLAPESCQIVLPDIPEHLRKPGWSGQVQPRGELWAKPGESMMGAPGTGAPLPAVPVSALKGGGHARGYVVVEAEKDSDDWRKCVAVLGAVRIVDREQAAARESLETAMKQSRTWAGLWKRVPEFRDLLKDAGYRVP